MIAIGALIAVVPRFSVALLEDKSALPCGCEAWRETLIELPEQLAGKSRRNILNS